MALYEARKSLAIWVLTAEVLGLLAVILASVWLSVFGGGFDWDQHIFNYHPLMMILGMVFFYGNGVILYRITPTLSKTMAKYLHAGTMLLALCLAIVGLVAVFHFASAAPTKVSSLHSWIGMSAILMFCMQWLFGFLSFLVPRMCGEELKEWYLPLHQWMGTGIFATAIAAVLLGLSEKTSGVEAFGSENILTNVLGLSLLFFGLTVAYIVTYGPFARPKPELDGEHMPLK